MKRFSETDFRACAALCGALARKLHSRLLSRRTARFAAVGAAATFSYFLLGLLFVNLLKLPALAGNCLAYVLSFAVSYLGQCLWTFEAAGSHRKMLPRFALTQLGALALNTFIIGACMRLGMSYLAAMLLAIVVVPVIVYLTCKYWVFPQKRTEAK